MNNNCGAFLSSGLGDCNARMKDVVAIMISAKGTTYTAAQLATIVQSKANVALASGIKSLYVPVSGFEDTTEAPKLETSNTGSKGVFDDQVPSAIAYFDRSFADYKTLWDMNNSIVYVEMFTKDGKRLMTNSSNGVYRGFTAELYAPMGLPKFGDPMKAHPIYLNFKYTDEFNRMEALPMSFAYSEIQELSPVGLSLKALAPYASGDVLVKATKRNAEVGYAGLDTWVVIDSNVASAAVTAVAGTDGTYTLTIQKGSSPVDLAAGDYVTVQGNKTVSTFATYITNPVRIDGV